MVFVCFRPPFQIRHCQRHGLLESCWSTDIGHNSHRRSHHIEWTNWFAVGVTGHLRLTDIRAPLPDRIGLQQYHPGQLVEEQTQSLNPHGGRVSITQAVFRLRHTSQGRFLRLFHCRALPNSVLIVKLRLFCISALV